MDAPPCGKLTPEPQLNYRLHSTNVHPETSAQLRSALCQYSPSKRSPVTLPTAPRPHPRTAAYPPHCLNTQPGTSALCHCLLCHSPTMLRTAPTFIQKSQPSRTAPTFTPEPQPRLALFLNTPKVTVYAVAVVTSNLLSNYLAGCPITTTS